MAALVSYRLRHFDFFSKTTSYEDTRLARNVPQGALTSLIYVENINKKDMSSI
jgi:hypothetical protein